MRGQGSTRFKAEMAVETLMFPETRESRDLVACKVLAKGCFRSQTTRGVLRKSRPAGASQAQALKLGLHLFEVEVQAA